MPTLALPLPAAALGPASHLEKSLEAVPRVCSARVEPDAGRVLVEHDGADESELRAVLARAGARSGPEEKTTASP